MNTASMKNKLTLDFSLLGLPLKSFESNVFVTDAGRCVEM